MSLISQNKWMNISKNLYFYRWTLPMSPRLLSTVYIYYSGRRRRTDWLTKNLFLSAGEEITYYGHYTITSSIYVLAPSTGRCFPLSPWPILFPATSSISPAKTTLLLSPSSSMDRDKNCLVYAVYTTFSKEVYMNQTPFKLGKAHTM